MKKTSALFALCSLMLAVASPVRAAVQLGLQGWTANKMTFDQVVAFAEKHGIKQLQLIGAQFDPKGTKEETLRKKAILDAKGLTCYTFGVNGTSMNKEDNRKLFEFAKLIGAKIIVVEPKNLAEWDNLEELVKEYDLKLAIHNHGKGTVYGDPATVQGVLAKRDKRIGVCLDVGWVTAAGFDAAKVFREYGDRVYDIHFKDKKVEKAADGKDVILDVELGTGAANYAGLFAELKKSKWSGVMAIETDNRSFQTDPNQMVSEGKKFFETMNGKGGK
ncbi:MAG: sugar phosphate isomerase/epimerase [Verrucomicrobia bacterium]|nr:sugar phosphate isomerase/epimerase [Verrucomicrobiota bacterium]